MPHPDWYIVARTLDVNDSSRREYQVIRGDQVTCREDLVESKGQAEILGDMEYNSAVYRVATVRPGRGNQLDPGAEVQAIWRGRSLLTTDPNDTSADDLASLPTPFELATMLRDRSR